MHLEKHKKELLFLPLGGSGEIGMNLNLYQLNGKWLIIDMGAGFADDYLPGIDMIVPDITFLIEHKDDIVGLVLTHAHEDHLGSVQYLWDELQCPIYTTPFTAAFLRAKLIEMRFASKVNITELAPGSRFTLDPFDIELVPLTHSTLEMHAIFLRTPLGNVMHTGDWKFDHDPLIGQANDEAKLRACGDEGVLAMIGDSTNVFNPGVSGSEGDLKKSLTDLIASCSKMVAVTTFASNVARIETIIKAAATVGRKVVIAGRSLHRIIRAAQEAGYLLDLEPFIDESQIGSIPREKILLLCTGCQGEPMAAINKIATLNHPHIRLAPGDTVIFSSKIIPGNEKKIFRLFNQFVRIGVEVLTEKDHFVHVSGHPAKQELELMYNLIRPDCAIPVHGELVHMHEHARLALEWGVKQSLQIENGDVVKLAPGTIEKVARVESGYLGIDGNFLLAPNCSVLKARRRMRDEGIIIVNLLMKSITHLITEPIIHAPGCLDEFEDSDIFKLLKQEVVEALENHLAAPKKSKTTRDAVIDLTKATVRRIVKRIVGKKPIVHVHIEFI